MLRRFIDGQMDTEQFIAQADQMLRLMALEEGRYVPHHHPCAKPKKEGLDGRPCPKPSLLLLFSLPDQRGINPKRIGKQFFTSPILYPHFSIISLDALYYAAYDIGR